MRSVNRFAETLIEAISTEQAGQQAVGSDARPSNVVCSPLSVVTALAIVMLGANGTTLDELVRVLAPDPENDVEDGVPRTSFPSAFHSSMGLLSNSLNERNHRPESESGSPDDVGWRTETRTVELTMTNGLWGERAGHWLPEFLVAAAEQYGASLHPVSFADDPGAARQAINRWVSDATSGRIEDLLGPEAIDHLTRLVVVNAIYFKANWLVAFQNHATTDADFVAARGPVEVPMMRLVGHLSYSLGDDWQAVELPYVFGELSLLAVMPKHDTTTQNDSDRFAPLPTIDEIDAASTTGRVELWFPRFDINTMVSLRTMLTNLGLSSAFSDAADLSAMTSDEMVGISDVFHHAGISVDEHGTEAVAATAFPEAGGIGPSEDPVELHFDHPFRFWLRDVPTGLVIFAGDVADPSR